MSAERQITLLQRLRECDLLEPAQLDELARLPESGDPDPRVLGRVLLQRQLLTRFQINLIAQGKAKDLRIGPFLLLDKLGEGGMGQVFKARHQRMSRLVALKLMRKEKLANPDSVKRFYREVQAASQLNHPNIVTAYDADQVGALHYFSMEYVEGMDLSKQVKQNGPVPVALACEYVRQTALGLQHAHEKGLIHRDIKPHNLLLAAGGNPPVVKILDMGLARLQGQGDTSLTQTGQVLGTPDYLAPEQAYDSRKADIRSDIYSLGCTLYFLLSGKAPFTGETLAQVLLMHHMEEPPSLVQRRPEVPAALAAVVNKMMAKSPDQRFQTPAEVANALAPFARGETVPVVPVAKPNVQEEDPWALQRSTDDLVFSRSIAGRTRGSTHMIEAEEPPRRGGKRAEKEESNRSLLYVLIGVGAAVPLLGLAVLAVVLLALSGRKVDTNVAQSNTEPGKTTTVKAGTVPENNPPVDRGKAGDIFDAIAQAVKAGKISRGPAPGVGQRAFYDVPEEGALLTGLEVGLGKWNNQDVIHSIRPIYQTRNGRVLGPLQGPALENIVKLEAKPGYAIGDVSLRAGLGLDSLAVTFMAIKGEALDPAKSYSTERVGGPGGRLPRFLAGSGAPVVGIFGWTGGSKGQTSRLGLVTVGSAQPQPPVVTPGSVPFPKEALVRIFAGHQPNVKQVILSPDGQQALSLDSLTVHLWDVKSVEPVRSFQGHNGTVGQMAVSKDWRRLLTAGADGTVRLWDLTTGEQLHLFRGAERATCVALSDDGRYAATGHGSRRKVNGVMTSQDTVVRLWDLQMGKEAHVFNGPKRPIASVGFTLDGMYVVSTDSLTPGFSVWDVENRRSLYSGLSRGWRRGMRVSPLADGNVALLGDDGSILHCNPITRKVVRLLPGQPNVKAVFVARSGKRCLIGGGTALFRNGQLVSQDHEVRLLEIPTGKELVKFGTPTANLSVSMSEDGRFVLSGGDDGVMRLWDLTKTAVVPEQPVKAGAGGELARLTLNDPGFHLVLDREGKTLAHGSFSLSFVDVVENKVLRSFSLGEGRHVASLAFCPDGKHVVAGCKDDLLRLVEVPSGKVVRTFQGDTTYPQAVAVSPDGELVACVGGKFEKGVETKTEVRLWQVKTGKQLPNLEGHKSMVRCVAFTSDSKRLITADGKQELRVWNLADGKVVKVSRLPMLPWFNFCLSADDKRILYASQENVVLWDVEQEKEVRRVSSPKKSLVRNVVFVNSDRWAVAVYTRVKSVPDGPGRTRNVYSDCTLRVWDLENGRELKSFAGPEQGFLGLSCSPDGKRAYSSGPDRILQTWDLSGVAANRRPR